MPETYDSYETRCDLEAAIGKCRFYSLPKLSTHFSGVDRLPFSIRILLESALRNEDGYLVQAEHVEELARWEPGRSKRAEIPFMPARAILQDFTGVPAIADLAAMRSAMVRLGGRPQEINPRVPVDLVIDHSVQVDFFGADNALARNVELEFSRNNERYEFLHWGQKAFKNFRVVPPNTGIVHQVNLEYLAQVALTRRIGDETVVLPDSLVGTDSHTTMINGLGVLGWGVGGIEAEAVMLGQPVYMLVPDVVGFKLRGQLPSGATATDLVLAVTQRLRQKGVVGKFVEFFGEGLEAMSLPDRATLANMAPEYGATVGFFAVDEETLRYLRMTGRDAKTVDLVERYTKEQGLFRTSGSADPVFTDTIELDLAEVQPSLAGPKRPQDLILLRDMKPAFRKSLTAPTNERGFELAEERVRSRIEMTHDGSRMALSHGAVAIAAITSCTNTSNPSVMVAAGLLAKKAVERGLHTKPYVKTSLAPGSKVVTEYLKKAGLLAPLEKLGFHVVGYGCTTCIGNSGPLPEKVANAVREGQLVICSVLSGNRNFEGRISPLVKANYLASPPLVVAYAIAGMIDIDFSNEPIGTGSDHKAVYLSDIWPSQEEITQTYAQCLSPDMYAEQYATVFNANERWNAIRSPSSEVYDWNEQSTYIQEPPFFQDLSPEPAAVREVRDARVLVMAGDSLTTDHISPAGSIPADGPAGKFLQGCGVQPADFNSFGSRRGNDRIMARGTFANVRLKNLLIPGSEGGITMHWPSNKRMSIYDAAQLYIQEGTPLIVLGGSDYGMGSSRDWAAKGTLLLGIRAVIAKSFERIHRSNLIGMGVLPLEFLQGQDHETLALSGQESYDIEDLNDDLKPGQTIKVVARGSSGSAREFAVTVRVDTPVEMDYYRHGGILHMVLRNMLKASR